MGCVTDYVGVFALETLFGNLRGVGRIEIRGRPGSPLAEFAVLPINELYGWQLFEAADRLYHLHSRLTLYDAQVRDTELGDAELGEVEPSEVGPAELPATEGPKAPDAEILAVPAAVKPDEVLIAVEDAKPPAVAAAEVAEVLAVAAVSETVAIIKSRGRPSVYKAKILAEWGKLSEQELATIPSQAALIRLIRKRISGSPDPSEGLRDETLRGILSPLWQTRNKTPNI
jgi:hypothetical protein